MNALTLLLGLTTLGGVGAQSSQVVIPPVPPVPPYDASWTKEVWTADERPYLEARKEVEGYVLGRRVSRTKTDITDQTARAVAGWRGSLKDPVALYRAAYYEWMLSGLDYSPEAQKFLRANWIDMGTVPSPHSREYDRLRMLREGFLNEVFLVLGERLYKADPNDREIALKLEWTNACYGPGSRKRAVEIAEWLLKTGNPEAYPAIYYAYGEAHAHVYTSEPTSSNLKKAFWGYRKYLVAGPSWRPKAIEAQRHLSGFEEYLKKHGIPVPQE